MTNFREGFSFEWMKNGSEETTRFEEERRCDGVGDGEREDDEESPELEEGMMELRIAEMKICN